MLKGDGVALKEKERGGMAFKGGGGGGGGLAL